MKHQIITDIMTPKIYPLKDSLFDNRILWRVTDVASYLKVSKGHVYNLCSRREIPFVKKGKQLYFIPKEIEDWVLQGN